MADQDFATKQEIRAGVAGALKAALAKHEAALIEAAAAEAAGNRKLAKTGDDRLVPIPIDKNAMEGYGPQAAGVGNQSPGMSKDEMDSSQSCPMCGGHAELLGHLGSMAHFRCRNCGAMAAFPAHKGDGDEHSESSHSESTPELEKAEVNPKFATCPECGEKEAKKTCPHQDDCDYYRCPNCGTKKIENPKGELEKVTPPDISEKVVHKLKDEYGHDKEGKAKAFATAWKIHNQKAAKKSEIEVPPTSTVIDKPAKGAKLPGKPAAVAAPGSGGLKKDAAMPHKEAHPDTAAALTELRGIHQGTIPHPETVASLHALRGTHPETTAGLNNVRSMSPKAMAAKPVDPHAVTAIAPRPTPTGMAPKPAQGAITGAEKRAAGIGFLSNLISRFKGIGNKTWSDMAGRGPANIARAARTAATRMALSEKDATKKALIVDGAMKAEKEPTDHKFEPKKKPSRLESDVKLCKNCGKPYDAHKTDVEKAEYMEKALIAPGPSRPNTMPPVKKAAMAGGIPAAPKPPAAAKPPGAKMTMPKQPTMGKGETKADIFGKRHKKEESEKKDAKAATAHSKEAHAVRNKTSGKPWIK